MQKSKGEETSELIIATLKAEKEELESSLNKEKLQSLQLKEELTQAETRNADLYKVVFDVCDGWSCSSFTISCVSLETAMYISLRQFSLTKFHFAF